MPRSVTTRVHDCPACGQPDVEYHRLTCFKCWRKVPHPLRVALNDAYRGRVREPAMYREALAGVLSWCRDQRPGGYSDV